ncbi:MAG: ice-binding family protein [Ignavibacteria bacterium]|nr:ice-binding family protein [Ignavibacteria bacterium]
MKTNTNNSVKVTYILKQLLSVLLIVGSVIPSIAFAQTVYDNPAAVSLGTAANYRALSGTTLTISSGCTVTGNVGGVAVTNGGTVSGTTDVNNAAVTNAKNDLTTVKNELALRTPNDATLIVELAGKTLGRGVYSNTDTGTFGINGTLILVGTASDIFIFKTATTLITGTTCVVTLTGGALASNVYWQIGSAATIDGDFKGNILAGTYITQNGGSIDGRSLGLTAVTLGGASVLPVELISFSAESNQRNIELHWSTATEVNNYGFEIERSSLNNNFEKIGFIQGHGNSNSPKEYYFNDTPIGGTGFKYRLKQIDFGGSYEYSYEIEVKLITPSQLTLVQNYPNPFNPSTNIEFSIPSFGLVTLKTYDMLGREISELMNEEKQPGNYQVKFDGRNLSSGVYYYKLQFSNSVIHKKMLLIK